MTTSCHIVNFVFTPTQLDTWIPKYFIQLLVMLHVTFSKKLEFSLTNLSLCKMVIGETYAWVALQGLA